MCSVSKTYQLHREGKVLCTVVFCLLLCYVAILSFPPIMAQQPIQKPTYMRKAPETPYAAIRISGSYASASAYYNQDGKLVSVANVTLDSFPFSEKQTFAFSQYTAAVQSEIGLRDFLVFELDVLLTALHHTTTHTQQVEQFRISFDSSYSTLLFPILQFGTQFHIRKTAQSRFSLLIRTAYLLQEPANAPHSGAVIPRLRIGIGAEMQSAIGNSSMSFAVNYLWRSNPFRSLLTLYSGYHLPPIQKSQLTFFLTSAFQFTTPPPYTPSLQSPLAEQWINGGTIFHLDLGKMIFEAGFSVRLWGENTWNNNNLWIASYFLFNPLQIRGNE